jgi:Na+/H+ antiporter NhaC
MPEKIDVKNLTWQQITLCAVLLVAVIAAYKLFGELPAGVLLVVSSIVNLLLGRTDATPKGGDK